MSIPRKLLILIGSLLLIPGVRAEDFAVAEPTLMGGIILGVIFLGAIFAFLGTKTDEEHPFLRLFFFFISLLTITVAVNIMFISCITYMTNAGICELVGAYSNNMTYVFMYVPIIYFLVYLIYTIFTHLKQNKQQDEYQREY